MKIILNKIENFLKYKKEYEKWCKERCKNWEKGDIYLKLLNEKSIKKRKEIIKENFEEGTRQNSVVESYFCTPYIIFMWNNNENSKNIVYGDEKEKISIDKLYKILKNNKKTHLELHGTVSLGWGMEKIVELEI